MKAVLTLCTLFVALVGVAEEVKDRAAWRWSDETRAERRFDSKLAALRRAAAEAAGECDGGRCNGENIVFGRYTPEVLFPFELMEHLPLAYDIDPQERAATRAKYLARAEALKLGDDFFEELYAVARNYFDAQHELRQRGWGGGDICPERARALSAARTRFGRERFDRFLYEVVAPDAVIFVSSGDQATARLWLWQENGCP